MTGTNQLLGIVGITSNASVAPIHARRRYSLPRGRFNCVRFYSWRAPSKVVFLVVLHGNHVRKRGSLAQGWHSHLRQPSSDVEPTSLRPSIKDATKATSPLFLPRDNLVSRAFGPNRASLLMAHPACPSKCITVSSVASRSPESCENATASKLATQLSCGSAKQSEPIWPERHGQSPAMTFIFVIAHPRTDRAGLLPRKGESPPGVVGFLSNGRFPVRVGSHATCLVRNRYHPK